MVIPKYLLARLIISDARWGCLEEVGLSCDLVLQREESGRIMTLSLLVEIVGIVFGHFCVFLLFFHVFLSMYTYVVYVFLDAATLTEVFPCFFLGCKANARV